MFELTEIWTKRFMGSGEIMFSEYMIQEDNTTLPRSLEHLVECISSITDEVTRTLCELYYFRGHLDPYQIVLLLKSPGQFAKKASKHSNWH